MATSAAVGRNDPCPCGSGRKYKICCAAKKKGLTWVQWVIVAAVIAVVGLALASAFPDRAARSSGSGGPCPPGQVWSTEHGHCH